MISFSPGWPQTHCVAKDDLEPQILLPLSPFIVTVLQYLVIVGAGDQTYGSAHPRQALKQLSYIPIT